jgi:hypothetical protein
MSGAPQQRAEAKRHADHLARLAQKQEHRANAEAREAFFEQQAQLSVNRPLLSVNKRCWPVDVLSVS